MLARRSFLTRISLGALAAAPRWMLASDVPRPAAAAIHEAFAEVSLSDPAPGPAAAHEPPAELSETPAEVRPAMARLAWLPGYWTWDGKRLVWMRGVWRLPPPGMRWVPGYWASVDGEFRRVSGLWLPVTQTRLEYLPPPPPRRAEDDARAPSTRHVYIPGGWQYRGGAYVWRAGYWSQARKNWTWTAARFIWTPGGVVYSPGYWDYPLAQRGVAFAAAVFHDARRVQGGAPYAPRAAWNPLTQKAVPVERLLERADGWPWPLAATTDEARDQARLLSEHLRQLSALRRKFESVVSQPPTTLELPSLPDGLAAVFAPLRRHQSETSARERRRVPGIGGRELPGVGGRTVPGVKQREVPGAGVGGAAPRGVLPGLGRGTPMKREDIVVPGVD